MSAHRSNIKTFDVYYSNKNGCKEGNHFALKGHNSKDHFRILIFDTNIENKIERLSVETDLINILKNNEMNLINGKNKQPLHRNIKSLSFK